MIEDTVNYYQLSEKLFKNQFNNKNVNNSIINITSELSYDDVIRLWLIPLLKILYTALKTKDKNLINVYLGERINRPFSSNASPLDKKLYFLDVIKSDTNIIKEAFKCLNIDALRGLDLVHQQLTETSPDYDVRIVFFGDCMTNHTNNLLCGMFFNEGANIKTSENYIGAWTKDSNFNFDEKNTSYENYSINVIAISFFTYWGIPVYRNLMKLLWDKKIGLKEADALFDSITEYLSKYISTILDKGENYLFIHNASGLPWLSGFKLNFFPWNADGIGDLENIDKYIGKINNFIDKLIKNKKKVFLIDERSITSKMDISFLAQINLAEDLLDENTELPIFHYSNMEFYVANEYYSIVKKLKLIRNKKVLFIDFDNTLWSGVMAEGPVKHYIAKQELISSLRKDGITLIALSKNEEKNIKWSQIRIDKDDFSLLKINWGSKISNILKSCRELNILPESCILLDDSEEELAIINTHLPQILCLNSKLDEAWEIIDCLKKSISITTKEAQSRSEYYQQKRERDEFLNREAYLNNPHHIFESLNISIVAKTACNNETDRIYELLNRTNQFNSSGIKFSKTQLLDLINNPDWVIFTFRLKDKFGDMGIVGLVIIEKVYDSKKAIVHNFILSCRAMGYGIEDFMLAKILLDYKFDTIVGILNQTTKNSAAFEFFNNAGFKKSDQEDRWILNREECTVRFPSWINK